MASLSGNKIKDTYQSLIKLTDNGNLTTGAKQLTDGFGNNSPLYISTTQIGIGVTPEATYDLHVYQNAKVGGNLTITGDLTVNGTTTTVDTDTLRVEDPLIEVARNNTSSDAVDIGIYGKYAPSGTTLYAGLFRDTGDDKFKLFKSLQEQPTTTVNTSGTGYAKAGLVIGDLESTAGIFSGDVSIPQTNKIRFDGSSGHTYISETADSNLKFFVAGIEQINVSNNLLDINSPIAMNSNNISGGGTFTATTFSGQLDGTISSTTTATTQSTGDNSTKVATTAYVDASIGNSTLAEVLVNGDTTGGGNIVFGDSDSFLADDTLMFGASNDLVIYHDGSNSFIREKGTGNLYIDSDVSINLRSYTGAENMLVATKDGAVDLYYDASKKLETTSTGVTVTGAVSATTFSGQLDGTISSATTAVTQSDGDNSTKVATTAYVDTAIQGHDTLAEILTVGNTTGGTDIAVSANDSITFTDSSKAKFGASSDLEIYHSGSHTFIENDTGYLMIRSDTAIYLRSATGNEQYIVCSKDGPVELYYNDVKKFETTNTGINVTGGIAGDDSVFIEGNTNPNFTAHDITNETYTSLWSGDTEGKLTFNHNNFRITYAAYNFTGTDLVTITSGGNVGIGTDSPAQPLSVHGNFLVRTTNADGNKNRMQCVVGGSSDAANLYLYYGNSGDGTVSVRLNAQGDSYLNGGNVGIGTTSPSYELDVSGEINATTRYRKNGYEIVGQNSTELRLANASYWQTLALYTNGTPRLTIDSSGKVGIGVTSPAAKLHVSGDTGGGDSIARFQNTNSTAKSTRLQLLDSAGTVGDALIAYDHSNASSALHYLGMGVNNSTTLVINNSDQVGIGTTTPNEKLVIGTTGGTQNIEISNSFIQSFNRSGSPGYASLGFYASSYAFNVGDATFAKNIKFTDGAAYSSAASIRQQSNNLILSGGSDGYYFNKSDNSATHMRIDSSGNLSLPTATSLDFNVADFAQIKFKESGAITIDSDNNQSSRNFQFKDGDGSSLMFIGDDGNVGIGTTSPRNDANFVTLQVGSTATAASQIVLDDNDSNGPWRIISNQSLIINDDATERMRIESDGTVQITNSTSPKLQLKRGTKEYTTRVDNNNKFVIQEEGGNEFFVVESGASSNSIRIDSSGKVGIGTTNPQNKFVIKEGSNVDMEFGSEADGCFIQTYNRTTSSWGYLRFIAGGGERMRITRVGGEVLINQTSDLTGQIFQVNGMIDQTDVTKALRVYNGSTFLGGIGSGQWAISATYANDYALYAQNNLLFHAGTGSSIDMMIDANHNVGIATTSPSAKLHVNGVITANDTIQVQGDDSGFVCKNAAGTVIGTIGAVSSSTTNIGMFTVRNNGNNRIVLHANGSSYFNGGNVGIGTTSPNQQLDVSGNIAVRGGYKIYFNSEVNLNRYIGASSSNDLDIAADDDINYRSNFNRFFNGSTEFARLSGSGVSWLGGGSNGYVGIGTTSPTVPLAVHGQQKWYTTSADGNELRGFFNPGGSGDDAEFSVYKADGATEGVVWRGAGNSYIRIDSTSLKFINFYYGISNVGQIVTGGSNVLYQSNSDYRLKENVVEMTGALDRISQLKPSRYNFISHPGEQVDGFMAHELQEVVPQAVSGEKDEMNEDGTPKYQGVDHSQIVPLLVGAIKELKAEIETLKTQINK